jgi:PKD repeat protein
MTRRKYLLLVLTAAVFLVCGESSAFALTGESTIATIAGSGIAGFAGDGGPALSAQLNEPRGVAVDSQGNVYISDFGNQRLREVSADGRITTLAGNGMSGFSGDGGSPASTSLLHDPTGVAVDDAGNVYFADSGNNRVREISAAGGISTVAGNGLGGYSGDGGPARAAELNLPNGVAVDGKGNVYIADDNNNRIRKVSGDGTITTIAGTGTAGYNGDGLPATAAQLFEPTSVAVDAQGNVYIADFGNGRVREVGPGGTIATIAGDGNAGTTGDGGPATSAEFQSIYGLAVDASHVVYVVDNPTRVRKVSGAKVTALAGTDALGFSGDGGPASSAQLQSPGGVAVDARGDVYVADSGNARIRKVSNRPPLVTFTASPATGLAPLTVSFDYSGSADPDGELLENGEWDFGDGATASVGGRTTSHTYVHAGTFTAKLTLRDDKGAAATATRTITVVAPNVVPSASFTATPATGRAPLKARFDGSGSRDPDGSIRTYTWRFGDGASGAGKTTSHSYRRGGTFTVVLTVMDDRGASASTIRTVTVRSTVRLGGQRSQRLLAQKGITVTARCDEACVLRATGVVRILHTRFALRLRGARATLPAAGATTLKLAFSPLELKRFRQLFTPRSHARVAVTVRATYAAGASTSTRTIAVRR